MIGFLTNFAVAFVSIALMGAVLSGAIAGIIAFFYWLSGGALWGLLCTVVALPSFTIATAFAIDEARK